MGNEVRWKALVYFLLIVGAAAAAAQWMLVGASSVLRVWSLIGTAVSVSAGALLAMDRWLWRLRVRGRRPFGWVTKVPDVSGRWTLTMTPRWKRSEPVVASLTITQTLFSLQLNWHRPAGHGMSRAAALYSPRPDTWRLACTYEYFAGLERQEHTVKYHQGALDLEIVDLNWMQGDYWTNKETGVDPSQLSDADGTDEDLTEVSPPREMRLVATAGTVSLTRDLTP